MKTIKNKRDFQKELRGGEMEENQMRSGEEKSGKCRPPAVDRKKEWQKEKKRKVEKKGR